MNRNFYNAKSLQETNQIKVKSSLLKANLDLIFSLFQFNIQRNMKLKHSNHKIINVLHGFSNFTLIYI